MHYCVRILILLIAGCAFVCLLFGLYGKGWLLYDTPADPAKLEFDTVLKFQFGVMNVSVCVTVVENNTICMREPIEKVEFALLEAFRNVCLEIPHRKIAGSICDITEGSMWRTLLYKSPVYEHFRPLYNLMTSAVVFNGLGLTLLVVILLAPIKSILVQKMLHTCGIILTFISSILVYTALGKEHAHNNDMAQHGDDLFYDIPTRNLENKFNTHVLTPGDSLTMHTPWALPLVGIGALVNLVICAVMVFLLVEVFRSTKYAKMDEETKKRPV